MQILDIIFMVTSKRGRGYCIFGIQSYRHHFGSDCAVCYWCWVQHVTVCFQQFDFQNVGVVSIRLKKSGWVDQWGGRCMFEKNMNFTCVNDTEQESKVEMLSFV